MTDNQEMLPVYPEGFDLEATIEAAIFMSKEPVSSEQISELLAALEVVVGSGVVRKALNSLLAKWDDKARPFGRGLMLKKVAGGYLFCTALEQAQVVKTMIAAKPLELSKAQIEVLSIIAYRQPITRVDVDEIRGVDSSFAIKRLMQLKLLKILGKSEGLGRPLLYGTTKHFLEFFTLNSLNDLPTLKQFESLSATEVENVDLAGKEVSLVDLFKSNQNSAMFSEDIERQSEEALKSLDDALLRIDSTEKSAS
jgi:segregation and condensation protein B